MSKNSFVEDLDVNQYNQYNQDTFINDDKKEHVLPISSNETNNLTQENFKTSRESDIPDPNTITNTQQPSSTKKEPVRVAQKVGRNEKVMITNGSETKELKWKKAKILVESGQWRIV